MDTVDTREQILANVLRFDAYRISPRPDQREFYSERLRLGKIFVGVPYKGRTLFCPSRFAGYRNNTLAKHVAFEYKSGSVSTPRISSVLGFRHESSKKAEEKYLALCEELSTTPSGKSRTYWVIADADSMSSLQEPRGSADSGFPDEVDQSDRYPEGAVKQVLINAYERNPEARQACIDHHGVTCEVCRFDFEAHYGAVGRGFIHVHHVRPLALRNAEYEVDPITDLRPVCPNCHAMLHKSDPPFSIEEMRELMASCK